MKNLYRLFILLIIVCVFVTTNTTYAGLAHFPTGGTPDPDITNATQNVWGTIVKIVQIISFGAVLFAGLRYMFAAPDARADIKKSLGVLALGAIIVFSASSIVNFVINTANEIF